MIEGLGIIVVIWLIILGRYKPRLTAILSPLVAIILIVFTGLYESVICLLLAPIAVIGPCITILFSGSDIDTPVWPRIYARLVLALVVMAVLCITLGVLFGPAAILGLLIFVLFVVSLIAYGLTSRYATAVYVLSTIGSCIRQNLPLPMALETAARGRSDRTGLVLRQIRRWLIQGYSLGEAIRRGYPTCYSTMLSMITTAEGMGQLPAAFDAVQEELKGRAPWRRVYRPGDLAYPFILLVLAGFILLGILTFVMPQYQAVMEEMVGGSLNRVTLALLAIAGFVSYGYGGLLWLLVLGILMLWPLYMHWWRRARRLENPSLLSRIGDFLKWHLPILHWFEQNFAMIQTGQALHMSLCAGITVDGSLSHVLQVDMNHCFKRRIRKWLQRVEAGENIAQSARRCRLPETLAWTFDTEVNQGNTLAVLEMLTSFYRSNYSYRIHLARHILYPTVTIMLACMVGFIVLGIFLPSVQIITSLAGNVVP